MKYFYSSCFLNSFFIVTLCITLSGVHTAIFEGCIITRFRFVENVNIARLCNSPMFY